MTTTIDLPRTAVGDDWWDELDGAVLDCLTLRGASSPEEIGRAVGLSASSVGSVLAMLAVTGKVRITRVELTGRVRAAAA